MGNSYRLWFALSLLAIVLLVAACGATQKGPVTEGDANRGRDWWTQSACVGCHGINAEGSTGGPSLTNTPLTVREVIDIVRRGGPGMPRYPASQISEQDLQDMYAWFQNPVPVETGDRGPDLWVQSGCGGCHGVNGEGGSATGLRGEALPFDVFQRVVRGGAEGMPAYSTSQISDVDLQRMYDWLRSQGEVPDTPEMLWTQSSCGGCHGANAEGGSATALASEALSFDVFQGVVRSGAEGMPAYSTSQISDTELQLMYDWLPSQTEVPVTQETLWVQSGCGACHGSNSEGGLAAGLRGEAYSFDEFQQVVREGEEGMPAYSSSQISDADLRRMYDWLMARP